MKVCNSHHSTQAVLYGFHQTSFGQCLIGILNDAVCYLIFTDTSSTDHLQQLANFWNPCTLVSDDGITQKFIDKIFSDSLASHVPYTVPQHVSQFYKTVWECVYCIPRGHTVSYADVARAVGKPQAARAVGNALAHNVIAILIPCHRVVHASGKNHFYRWNPERKKALLAYEQYKE